MYIHPYLFEKLTEMVWILTHQILLDKNKRNFIEVKTKSIQDFFSFEHSVSSTQGVWEAVKLRTLSVENRNLLQ